MGHTFGEKLFCLVLLVVSHIIAFASCYSPGEDLVAALFCTALTGWIVFAALAGLFYVLSPLLAIAAGLIASTCRVLRSLIPTTR